MFIIGMMTMNRGRAAELDKLFQEVEKL